jgi:hypothetical protein
MDISKLNEEQKKKYYEEVCAAVGLDPKLGLLEFIWLDSGDGGRKLVLYALRGATDILRAHHGISITKLTKDVGDGYVSYMAEGTDKKGRTEIAVGASSTKNLSGKSLEIALMTAQTRSLRRLTLQFVGAGLLDESEVITGSVTSDVLTTSSPLSQIAAAQPEAKLNSIAGTDITDAQKIANKEVNDKLDLVTAATAGHAAINPDTFYPTLYQDPVKEGVSSKNDYSLSQNPPKEGVSSKSITDIKADMSSNGVITESQRSETPEPAKKRHRRTESEIALDTPEQASQSSEEALEASKSVTFTSKPEEPTLTSVALAKAEAEQEAVSSPVPPPEAKPVIVQNLPTPVQMTEYRSKLFKYTNDILPTAGLCPTEGIGGIAMKVRMFAKQVIPGAVELKDLSIEQWNFFFKVMEDKVANEGSQALVRYIDETIGVLV